MNTQDIYCVIMAGGNGTRFWPLSTADKPKQFHDVLGVGKTLIQQTYERLLNVTDKDRIYVITDTHFVDSVIEQLPELDHSQIIQEPMGMNTAACVLYSALKIYGLNPDAKLIMCPSDHLIIEPDKFAENVRIALDNLEDKNGLFTLGIEPTRPDTGYGYIQYIEGDNVVKKVKTFTEKPNKELAEQFLQSGDFLWNSGIFIWKAKTILDAYKIRLPEMYQSLHAIKDTLNTSEEENAIAHIYPTLQKVSIDVAILEKDKNVYVIPSQFGWCDLGTWSSLYDNNQKDDNENVIYGTPIKTYDANGNMIHIDREKAVVIQGLKDYIVVDTENALLICPLDKDQEVKTYVNDLKLSKGDKFI